MSWTIELTLDRNVSNADFDKSVKEMPYTGFTPTKQYWGWSHEVDICNPIDNKIVLHGAYYSINIARLFAFGFAGVLRKMGYIVDIGELRS